MWVSNQYPFISTTPWLSGKLKHCPWCDLHISISCSDISHPPNKLKALQTGDGDLRNKCQLQLSRFANKSLAQWICREFITPERSDHYSRSIRLYASPLQLYPNTQTPQHSHFENFWMRQLRFKMLDFVTSLLDQLPLSYVRIVIPENGIIFQQNLPNLWTITEQS